MRERHRRVLRALCETFVDGAAGYTPAAIDECAQAVEARVQRLSPERVREFTRALDILDTPLLCTLLGGRGRRFCACSPLERAAWLRRMEGSRTDRHRQAYQALRRLILFTWYAHVENARAVGWPASLASGRAPLVAWEGPLNDGARSDDAALRLSDPSSWRPHAASTESAGIKGGQTLVDGKRLRADVCVIGSGAGGSVAACRLAEAGLDVVLLEEGSHWSAPDFDDDEGTATQHLYADAGLRATTDSSVTLLQGRCIGGGTTINWLLMMRPRAWALEEWERAGIELLGARSLLPEITCIEQELGAAFVGEDAHDAQNRVLLDGCAHLGWRVELPRISARNCVRAGTCGLGCRWGARRGPLSIFLPRALTAGARVLADVRADRISGTASHRRVEATVLDRATGAPRARITIGAPTVIVAAGAVGTPVLLQRSGLGNNVVGAYLRLHPTTAVFGQFECAIYGGAGIPQSVACTEFHDAHDGWGYWIEAPPIYPGLAAASMQGIGSAHAQVMADYTRKCASIVLVRDGMNGESQGEVRVGRAGTPVIRYSIGMRERTLIAQGLSAAARIQLAAGARVVRTLHVDGALAKSHADADAFAHLAIHPNRVTMFSAHVNGTCRMGADVRSSACAPEGELRGAPGIWVADGSLFPSAPGVNPQATIMALASLVASRAAE
jgi:choline dehydrogenase-like flavoprotein